MMMPIPNPVRLSAHPYLLAAVLAAGIAHRRDAGLLAQKAHRLINKHSYRPEVLDRTAQCAFGTDYNNYVGEDIFAPWCSLVEIIATDALPEEMVKLENKDASFGHLRDFINHVLSEDN